MQNRVLIVGAGPTGLTAARGLRLVKPVTGSSFINGANLTVDGGTNA